MKKNYIDWLFELVIFDNDYNLEILNYTYSDAWNSTTTGGGHSDNIEGCGDCGYQNGDGCSQEI